MNHSKSAESHNDKLRESQSVGVHVVARMHHGGLLFNGVLQLSLTQEDNHRVSRRSKLQATVILPWELG